MQSPGNVVVLLICGVANIALSQTSYGSNPEAGNYASVNGIQMYYEIYGDGIPLLLLHGNGGSIRGHSERIEFFSKKYKVIAVDSRAHGQTIDSTSVLTYELMAKDIHDLLDTLKVDSAFVWGQSDGGILAILLAMHYPEKVRRAAGFGINLRPDSTAVIPELILLAEEALETARTRTERQHLRLILDHPHIPLSFLQEIQVPFLVMSGDRDAIRLEHSLEIFRNIPRGFLFVMPASTHFGAYEHPEWFNLILDDFFERPFETISTIDKMRQ